MGKNGEEWEGSGDSCQLSVVSSEGEKSVRGSQFAVGSLVRKAWNPEPGTRGSSLLAVQESSASYSRPPTSASPAYSLKPKA